MSALPSVPESQESAAAEAETSRLYQRHAHSVFRFCLQRLRSREDADDAVQTTFLYALMSLRRGVVPEFENAWLLKIADNVCASRHRAATRRGRVESAHDLDAMQDVLRAPEDRRGHAEELRAALGTMPESQRHAIVLREWRGLSYREIGEELGLSQPAVETLIFRARRTLAAKLSDLRATCTLNLLPALSYGRSLLAGGPGRAAAIAAAGVAAVTAGSAIEHGVGHKHASAAARFAPARPNEAVGFEAARAPTLRKVHGAATRPVLVKATSGDARPSQSVIGSAGPASGAAAAASAPAAGGRRAPTGGETPTTSGSSTSAPEANPAVSAIAVPELPAPTSVLPSVPVVPQLPQPAPLPATSLPTTSLPPLPHVETPAVPTISTPVLPTP